MGRHRSPESARDEQAGKAKAGTDKMKKNHWLVKQEPDSYSWDDFVADGKTSWTGVRNYTARNNLRNMRVGDEVLYYHSGEDKAVVGIARVLREAYPDATADEGDWSAVDLKPVRRLPRAVTLREIKSNPRLNEMTLVRQSRLSVQPLTREEFDLVVQMARPGQPPAGRRWVV
jgi:predicted RNA-binding protein with PUA-like domain